MEAAGSSAWQAPGESEAQEPPRSRAEAAPAEATVAAASGSLEAPPTTGASAPSIRSPGARARALGAAAVRNLDVVAAVLAVLLAAWSLAALPPGGWPRLALAGLVVFVLPGYLLLAAAEPRRGPRRRWLAALGASPALVGLAALATALVPGGFRPGAIVAAVTVACVLLGVLAVRRREGSRLAAPGPRASQAPQPARADGGDGGVSAG